MKSVIGQVMLEMSIQQINLGLKEIGYTHLIGAQFNPIWAYRLENESVNEILAQFQNEAKEIAENGEVA